MDSAFSAITTLAASADRNARRQLVAGLRKLAASLEDNVDTIHRYGHIELEKAMIELGLDLKIFEQLADEDGRPKSVTEVAQKAGVDVALMKRILRYLASINATSEVSEDVYGPSNITNNLNETVTTAALYGICSPMYLAIPSYLKKNGYKNPTDETNTPFQEGWKTTKAPFELMMTERPEQLDHFNTYMALRRQADLSWLTVYPVKQEAAEGLSAERALYVNVGGGIGHQCAQFKERYPDLPGKVILQDLPTTIERALSTPGVEAMAHDFFQPQPIKGAKFYFMRGVPHNHPPHKVKKLFENIRDAMAPDSVLLVDETVLPTKGVGFIAASIDLTMLGAFASMERSEDEWRHLASISGLELVKTYTYNASENESVMDLRLPRS